MYWPKGTFPFLELVFENLKDLRKVAGHQQLSPEEGFNSTDPEAISVYSSLKLQECHSPVSFLPVISTGKGFLHLHPLGEPPGLLTFKRGGP
jgi:hypothetical protein